MRAWRAAQGSQGGGQDPRLPFAHGADRGTPFARALPLPSVQAKGRRALCPRGGTELQGVAEVERALRRGREECVLLQAVRSSERVVGWDPRNLSNRATRGRRGTPASHLLLDPSLRLSSPFHAPNPSTPSLTTQSGPHLSINPRTTDPLHRSRRPHPLPLLRTTPHNLLLYPLPLSHPTRSITPLERIGTPSVRRGGDQQDVVAGF